MVNKQKLEELKKVIETFEQKRNKKTLLDSLESWLLSVHSELKSEGLSENEINMKLLQILIEFGKKSVNSEQNELIKDALATTMLKVGCHLHVHDLNEPTRRKNMEMSIQVPEQIVVHSGTNGSSRIFRLENCTSPHEIKDYLQAVKLCYEIEKLQKTEGGD